MDLQGIFRCSGVELGGFPYHDDCNVWRTRSSVPSQSVRPDDHPQLYAVRARQVLAALSNPCFWKVVRLPDSMRLFAGSDC